jgi:membrane-bound serine protease (ClpP class)
VVKAESLVTFVGRTVLLGVVCVAVAHSPGFAQAVNPQQADAKGGFVTVPSPITSVHAVRRQCEKLLAEGARTIVFDIQPGKSEYGNCLNVAQYIEGIKGARTIAFVRQPLSGHAVMVALASGEIAMSTKATLGDIGRDEKTVREGMIAEYSDLAQRTKRPYRAIILGMLDRRHRVYKVTTARPDMRYVLEEELKALERDEQIVSKEVLIEAGQLGNFNGDQLRQIGLVAVTAESRGQVAELFGLPAKAAIEDVQVGVEWKPVQIRIDDFISVLTKEYVLRHVKQELDRGRNFFIFEIDSYGGDANAGMELAEFIRDMSDVKTVAYVPNKAISAAAFIALGCDEIVMHPEAKLGDCGAMFVEGGQFHYVPEKIVSIVSTALETIADAKGYPPTLARAMVEKDMIVHEVRDRRTGRITYLSDVDLKNAAADAYDQLRIVKPKGEFLTVNGKEALEFGLAQNLAESFDVVRELYGLGDTTVALVSPNWVDTMIWLLNTPLVSMLLIVGGILGLYLELKLPGIGMPSIIAALCFLLFFWSHFMGGTATGLEILLFLAGLVCLAIELFLLPGFGVFGLTGILLMVSSIVLASQTFVLPQGPREWQQLATNLGSMVFAFASLFAFAYLVSKYLPHVPLLNRVVLQPDLAMDGAPYSATIALSEWSDLVGRAGVAMTTLRPAGRAQFGDQFVDVVTEGAYIDAGAPVEVIEVTGNRVVVKQVT